MPELLKDFFGEVITSKVPNPKEEFNPQMRNVFKEANEDIAKDIAEKLIKDNPKAIYPPQEIIELNKRLDEVNGDGSTSAMEKYDMCKEIRREFASRQTQK